MGWECGIEEVCTDTHTSSIPHSLNMVGEVRGGHGMVGEGTGRGTVSLFSSGLQFFSTEAFA